MKLLRKIKAQLGLIELTHTEDDEYSKLGERREGESKSECVERKIPILIDEGMDQDQAVAVANELCEL